MLALHHFLGTLSARTLTFARVRVLLGAGLLMFLGCADEPIPTDPSAIDSAGVSANASVDAAAAKPTGFRLREQVGHLDLTEAGGSEEVRKPLRDSTGRVSKNAEELHRASLHAQRRASELGLVASTMSVDADGALYADFVDPAVAYADPRGSGVAPASDKPPADEDFAEKGFV